MKITKTVKRTTKVVEIPTFTLKLNEEEAKILKAFFRAYSLDDIYSAADFDYEEVTRDTCEKLHDQIKDLEV